MQHKHSSESGLTKTLPRCFCPWGCTTLQGVMLVIAQGLHSPKSQSSAGDSSSLLQDSGSGLINILVKYCSL